ncbi:MAG: glutaredoxin family protein [Candidatus Saccharimonadales bacterium]
MSNVTIYTTPTCAFCHMAKSFMQEEGIEYSEVDVASDQEAARALVEKTGQMAVPVIEVGEEFMVGFDKDKLKELVGAGQ